MVARGIVFSGLDTDPDGIVAHSIPRNAKNVNAAVDVMAEKSETPLVLNGIKFFNLKKNNPPTATSNRGIIFNIVVTNCNFPEATMPSVFTQVSNQIAPSPVKIASSAFVARAGKKVLKALTSDTAIAAFVHQIEIQ